MTKPETIAQLRRKIERLEAQIESLGKCRQVDWDVNREYVRRAVDAEVRVRQAMRILTGEADG